MTLPDAYDLEGRVALVTGAGSGIGRATAALLAEAGASVMCADIDGPAAEATAAEIGRRGGTATSAPVDVSDRAAVDQLVAGTVSELGRLDVMANIAGIMHDSAPVADTDEATLDRVLSVNLKGVFFCCQSAARVMTPQGSGSIVNMASGAIDVPTPGIVCYAIAKAGVAQLTKTLAVELAGKGVRVNAVAPGFVMTPMLARFVAGPGGEVDNGALAQAWEQMGRMTPLGRMGEPEDVAQAILYLASDASSFVTGQILRPNGGVSMP
jgi:3-oxoacyl-[acyl-carrier protein] reductase